MIKLFTLENDKLKLVREEVICIPEFNAILLADSSKNKDTAYSELLYVFCLGDWFSPYAGLSDEEMHEKAVNFCKLPSNYIPNKLVRVAIKVYGETLEKMYPSIRMYHSIQRGLNAASDVIDAITDKMYKKIAISKKNKEQDIETDLTTVIQDLTTLIGISKDIKTTIETFNKLGESLKIETAGDVQLMRGDRRKAMFEDGE